MDLIFVIGAVQAFLLSFIAIWKKKKHTGDIVLSIWLAFMGLHLLDHYFLTIGAVFDNPHLLGIGICFPMLEGPMMYWYVKVMVNENGKFKAKYLVHALPFLCFTIYLFFDFYFLSAEQKLVYYNANIDEPNTIFQILSILNVSIGPIYVIWSIILLRKFKKSLLNKFSYTEKISLNWLKIILWGLGFVWVIVIVANVFGSFPILQGESITENIVYSSVVLVVFFIGLYGIKQQAILKTIQGSEFKNAASKTKKQISEAKNAIDSELNAESDELLNRLIRYMEDEKPFLNPELNIGDLANSLNLHSHQLSRFINNRLNKNFFEFVNDFRIQEFKRNVTDPKNRHISILGVAMDAGFNSKATFNRIFKNSSGQTPSQFRENFKF